MGNNFKRIGTTALAAAMTMSLAIPAFASSITLPADTGKTYSVYQIFTGTPGANNTLENVKWGLNGQLADGTDATTGNAVDASILAELATVANSTSDREKLNVINKYADVVETPYTTGNASQKLENIPDGYYLVKDTSTTGALSTYIVEVVNGDITMQAKVATPGFDKQIHDEPADAEAGHNNGWGESADHEINETFQFRLIATLPNDKDIDSYKAYRLAFEDSMNEAVTYEKIDSVTVKYGDNQTMNLTSGQYVLDVSQVGTYGGDFSVTIPDLKKLLPEGTSLQGVEVEVVYSAHLNEKALIQNTMNTEEANVNGAHLEYTRNPEWDGNGTPGPGDTEETPDDYVFVFTYDVNNQKVAEDGSTPLKDAEFKLYRDAAGTDEIALVKEGANTYRPASAAEMAAAGFEAATIVSEEDSEAKFTVKGLDAGTYYLKETKAPEGYTILENAQEIVITATHAEDAGETSATVTNLSKKVDGAELANGTNTIVNKKPSNLPSTGGVGTMLFYALGGSMAIGAGSVLVTKKRIKK